MRPNLLVIMPDQWRPDCLSAAGHPVVETPHLDGLAADGVRFTRTYTPSPVCMPARTSILTGLYPHNHGQWNNYGSTPPRADTYAHHLRNAGYRTCHVGKSHFCQHLGGGQHLRDHEPVMHGLGWDDVYEITGPHATRSTNSLVTDHWESIGCLDTFRDDYARRAEHGFLTATWPSPMPPGETLDDFVGQTACRYLADYEYDQPWLMFVGFPGPHEPWDPPADWAARYENRQMDPATSPPPVEDWLTPAAAAHRAATVRAEQVLPDEVVAEIRAAYYGKISHIDDWIGRLLATVEQRGWSDKTAVLFWSDHGEMLGDRNLYYKGVFYEASSKVPLIMRLPDRAGSGSERSQLASLVDLFPTLLELGGCEPRPGEFGRSLIPLVADAGAAHHDVVCSEFDARTMIRDDRFKLVVDAAGEALELYDMDEDPGETQNLVGHKDGEEIARRLKERLLRWELETRSDQRHMQGQV